MAGVVKEAQAITKKVAFLWNPRRQVVKRRFEFDALQPAIIWQAVEHVKGRVQLEIQLVRVGARSIRPFRGIVVAER